MTFPAGRVRRRPLLAVSRHLPRFGPDSRRVL